MSSESYDGLASAKGADRIGRRTSEFPATPSGLSLPLPESQARAPSSAVQTAAAVLRDALLPSGQGPYGFPLLLLPLPGLPFATLQVFAARLAAQLDEVSFLAHCVLARKSVSNRRALPSSSTTMDAQEQEVKPPLESASTISRSMHDPQPSGWAAPLPPVPPLKSVSGFRLRSHFLTCLERADSHHHHSPLILSPPPGSPTPTPLLQRTTARPVPPPRTANSLRLSPTVKYPSPVLLAGSSFSSRPPSPRTNHTENRPRRSSRPRIPVP